MNWHGPLAAPDLHRDSGGVHRGHAGSCRRRGWSIWRDWTHDIGKLVLAELYPAKDDRGVDARPGAEPAAGAGGGAILRRPITRRSATSGCSGTNSTRSLRYVVAYHEQPEKLPAGVDGIGPEEPARLDDRVEQGTRRSTLMTHVVACANTLTRELGLGLQRQPEAGPGRHGSSRATTKALFDSRTKEDVDDRGIRGIFHGRPAGTCPSCPLRSWALASEGRMRTFEAKAAGTARRSRRYGWLAAGEGATGLGTRPLFWRFLRGGLEVGAEVAIGPW